MLHPIPARQAILFDVSEMRTTRSVSPDAQSIQSQAEIGSQDGSQQDQNFITQAHFATQVLISPTSPTSNIEPLRRQDSSLNNGRQDNAVPELPLAQTSGDILRAVFTKQNTCQEDLTYETTPNTTNHSLGFEAVTKDLESLPSSAVHELIQEELIPEQIVPRTLVVPSLNAYKQETTKSTRHSAKISDDWPQSQVMPACMIDLMRVFRTESLNGRYIPKRLQCISKEQDKVLDSDESWQPSLVGRPTRQGTVPLELLTKLITRADAKAIEAISSHAPAMQISPVQDHAVSPNAGDEQDVEQRVKNMSPSLQPPASFQDQVAGSMDSSGDDEQEENSENVSWSDSESFRSELPADSPSANITMPGRAKHPMILHQESTTEDNGAEVTQHMGDEQQVETNSNAVTYARLQEHSCTTDEHFRIRENQNSNSKHQKSLENDHEGQEGRHDCDRKKSHSIHVHRTPYHPKSFVPEQESPTSSTVMVPGTFDANGGLPSDLPHTRHANGEDSNRTDHHRDVLSFEHNSSEDEALMRTPFLDSSRNVSPKRNHFISSSVAVAKPLENQRLTITKRSLRTGDHEEQQPSKRKRTWQEDADMSKAKNNDYGKINQDLTDFRRNHFQRMRERQIKDNSISATSVQSGQSPESSASTVSALRTKIVERSIKSKQHVTAAASMPYQSHLIPPSENFEKGSTPFVSVDIAFNGPDTTTKLFERFLEIYPSYEGQLKHFIAACQILKDLRSRSRATHPSLWDDFVFRHFHGYRQHLQAVMENCGNAMPYEVFYEHHIEEPTCLKRVIKPLHIDTLDLVSVKDASTSIPTSTTVDKSSMSHDQDIYKEIKQSSNQTKTVSSANSNEIRTPKSRSQSVTVWLERQAGAESPELGMSMVNDNTNVDIPSLDLHSPERIGKEHQSKPSSSHIRQTSESNVPKALRTWESQVSTPRLRSPVMTDATKPTISSKGNPDSVPKVNSKRTLPFARLSTTATTTQTPSSNVQSMGSSGVRLSSSMPLPAAHAVSIKNPKSQPGVKTGSVSKTRQIPKSQPDTVFKRFVRDYNTLYTERSASSNGSISGERFVDVSTWRQYQ